MLRYFRLWREALAANKKSILLCLLTWIPVCSGAAALSVWLFHTYALGFAAAVAYMLWFLAIGLRISMYIRGRG